MGRGRTISKLFFRKEIFGVHCKEKRQKVKGGGKGGVKDRDEEVEEEEEIYL